MKLVDLVSLTLAERRKEGRPQTNSADCSIATDGQCVVISGQQVSVTCPVEGGAQEKVYKLDGGWQKVRVVSHLNTQVPTARIGFAQDATSHCLPR